MTAGFHAFAGNPIIGGKRQDVNSRWLQGLVANEIVRERGGAQVLPVYDGRPLISSSRSSDGVITWALGWQSLEEFGSKIPISLSSSDKYPDDHLKSYGYEAAEEKMRDGNSVRRKYDKLVYLGESNEQPYFAVDVSSSSAESTSGQDGKTVGKLAQSIATLFGGADSTDRLAFVDIRTLMIATNWESKSAMAELAVAGHARTLLEWHKKALYCGRCGAKTVPIEAGQRRQCTYASCGDKVYPRMDPVVIMLVIDKERDRVVLGRQSRFAPRMWSCLAGFIEPGESLEEAVRRETLEEVGIKIGEIVYHSSQPWPVGPSSVSCQLMVGFFAYAKTFDIHVDMKELEDAQWFCREDVQNALRYSGYKQTQQASAVKIHQLCTGERSKPEPMAEEIETVYVPGPYAIAHHLIASWAQTGPETVMSNSVLSKV